MRFKPGQKVVCTCKRGWRRNEGHGEECIGPKNGEIVTVYGYAPNTIDELFLYEYFDASDPDGFNEMRFEPLMDISELTEVLEQQPAMI